MKRVKVRREKIKRLVMAVMTVFILGGAGYARAQETSEGATGSRQSVYDPAGKRDPFKPFVKLTEKKNEIKPQANELLPPIKRYSLGEFNLVGVLWVGQQPKAMIVDPEKNTFVLSLGDEIGNSQGKIVEIRGNGILVEEKKQFENIFGEKKVESEMSVLAFKE